MACDKDELKHVPLFALLDDEEAAVLASQVEMKKFAPRQRIYKIGDTGGHAYVMVSGLVRVTTVDEDSAGSGGGRTEPRRIFRVCFDAGEDAAPDQRDRGGRNDMHRSGPARYCGVAGAQADGGDGYADRAGPAISRVAATGAVAGNAQSERSD